MDKTKKKRRWVRWSIYIALFGVILCIFIMLLLDNNPTIVYRGVAKREVAEFFLANEDKFEYVISRLIETNYEGSYLCIAVTRRTKDVVFSTDNFETYISSETLGIIADEEFVEYLRIILTEGRLGQVTIRKFPATTRPEYPMIFDANFGFSNPITRGAIYYFYSTERSPGAEKLLNIKGNWYMSK